MEQARLGLLLHSFAHDSERQQTKWFLYSFGMMVALIPVSALAVVLSTPAIAAPFNPLRTRIHAWIDRRFYRKKYDAQQALARFALTARDETDMNALTAELARVVDETLHPDGVRVWLRKTGRPT